MEIKHRPGKTYINTDGLSHIPGKPTSIKPTPVADYVLNPIKGPVQLQKYKVFPVYIFPVQIRVAAKNNTKAQVAKSEDLIQFDE
jgi:hypothetical protein